MIVSSLAWGEKYRRFIPRFEASVRAVGMEPKVLEMQGEPPCVKCAYAVKAQWAMQKFLEVPGPVLCLDVDAVIKASPLFPAGDYDFAAVESHPGHYEVSTLLIMPTHRATETLAHWISLMPADGNFPMDSAQFSRAVLETGAKVCTLRPEFGWVDAWYRPKYGNLSPVIHHNTELEALCPTRIS